MNQFVARSDIVDEATLGGRGPRAAYRFGLERATALSWNGLPLWIGIAYRFGLERATALGWNDLPLWIGMSYRIR